jgi:hypothetical protein
VTTEDEQINQAWREAQHRLEIKKGQHRAHELIANARARESGIGNVTEDPALVRPLLSVFRQLEAMGMRCHAER